MSAAIGYHCVKSTYGKWLPGDERGHWSTAWDDQIGYIEPHMLHAGDPVRKRMAEELMKHPAVCLSPAMIDVVIDELSECMNHSPWRIDAAAIEPTHFHLAIVGTNRPIENTMKWLAQELTKAVHSRTDHVGPVWSKGKWCEAIYDESHWRNVLEYIEQHNTRAGRGIRPYPFCR